MIFHQFHQWMIFHQFQITSFLSAWDLLQATQQHELQLHCTQSQSPHPGTFLHLPTVKDQFFLCWAPEEGLWGSSSYPLREQESFPWAPPLPGNQSMVLIPDIIHTLNFLMTGFERAMCTCSLPPLLLINSSCSWLKSARRGAFDTVSCRTGEVFVKTVSIGTEELTLGIVWC